MWKITNKSNRPHLFHYNRKVIIEFWNFWIEMAAIRDIRTKIDRPNYLENYINANDSFDIRFLTLNKDGKARFRSLTVSIIKLGLRELNKQKLIFETQNKEVASYNYNFDPKAHPLVLTDIFRYYFYEIGWETPWIWTDIVRIPFDRTIFQEKFKVDNKLSVCPYCDLTTIPSERSAWVEHFLPKAQFPFVCCNPHNVLPTCNPCNVAGSGKGSNFRNPVTNPFRQQIGDSLEFSLVAGNIVIQPNGDAEIESYLTLLKTRRRYRDTNVQRALFNTLIVTYNMIVKGFAPEDAHAEFQDFIKDIGRDQGHYFARKTLVQDIDAIKASMV